jgi:hypothetical protein
MSDAVQVVHNFMHTIVEVSRSPTYWEESRPGKHFLEDLCRNESHDAQRLRRNNNMTSTADAQVFEVEIVGQVGIIGIPACIESLKSLKQVTSEITTSGHKVQ